MYTALFLLTHYVYRCLNSYFNYFETEKNFPEKVPFWSLGRIKARKRELKNKKKEKEVHAFKNNMHGLCKLTVIVLEYFDTCIFFPE